jgi:hypothetical protein
VNRPSIVLEAALLAAPSISSSAQDLTNYVECILEWSKILADNLLALRLSETTTQSLFDAERFPLASSLEKLCRERGVLEFDGSTIARVITHLLEITPCLEADIGVREILIDNVVTHPDVLGPLEHCKPLQTERMKCLGLVVITQERPDNHYPLAIVSPEKTSPTSVSFTLLAIEHLSASEEKQAALLPRDFSGTVTLAPRPRSALERVNEATFWLQAKNDSELLLAIHCSILKNMPHDASKAETLRRKVHINESFFKTTRMCGTGSPVAFAERALRSIADAVLGQRLTHTHALRENAGPEAAQQCRNQDKAWRRDIDYEYHLHPGLFMRSGRTLAEWLISV